MPLTIYAHPDGPEADITPMPATPSRAEQIWADTVHHLDQIPGWVWASALATLGLLTLVMLPVARAQARKAGARINGKTSATDRKDRRLLAAVLTPAILFWLAVLIGSGRSLVGFGRDDLGWKGGWELLVPFTLDGVAVAFGALAFRAIAKERNPDRAYRVVWMATAASAAINFFHEVGGSTLGAGYLAILSLFGMLIFHELLAQFEEGAAWIKRTNPKFGLRWITWPTNTLCAWIAWRNYPPAEGTQASIGLAVEHLETVRRTKTERRAAEIDSPVWWMRLAPWTNVQALRAALETERAAAAKELSTVSANVTNLTVRLDRQDTQFRSERASAAEHAIQLETLIQDLRTQIVTQQETHSTDLAEALRQRDAMHAAETTAKVAAARAEASLPHLDDRRGGARGDRTGGVPKAGSPRTVLTDEAAVQKLLDHPGDLGRNIPAGDLREWSQKAIVETLEVGYGRAPRLLKAVSEAQRLRHPETADGDAAANQ